MADFTYSLHSRVSPPRACHVRVDDARLAALEDALEALSSCDALTEALKLPNEADAAAFMAFFVSSVFESLEELSSTSSVAKSRPPSCTLELKNSPMVTIL